MHKFEQSEEWGEIASEVMKSVPELSYLEDVSIGYLTANYSKKSGGMVAYAECIKVKDLYAPYCPHDILIVAYKDAEGMTDKQKHILMEHELMHIDARDLDTDGPIFKIRPHDLQDFKAIIDKYGTGWANE